ncbi:hypothetical protein JANLI_56980 [Janthinobacterium lividum]|nr:hypothetical protein JANLI_56980 [Janthinobacterium lividum]
MAMSTARSSCPWRRSRLRWASWQWRSTSAASRASRRHSSGASGAAPYCCDQPSGPWVKRRRSAACVCSSTSSAAAMTSPAPAADACSSTDWLKWSSRASCAAKKADWIGNSGTSCPGTSALPPALAATACISGASAATLWRSNSCFGVTIQPAWRKRATICRLRIESPPSSKKLSSRPSCSSPSTPRHTWASNCSAGPCGATLPPCCSACGAGSALRSTLPFAFSGRLSSATITDGTM